LFPFSLHFLLPRACSGEKCAVDSFVDFGAIYTLFACLLGFPTHFFFLHLFSLLNYFPNFAVSFYFGLQHVCVTDAWLFCVVVNLVICVSEGLLYIFEVVSPSLDFVFFSVLVQRLAGKSISEMTYFVSSGM